MGTMKASGARVTSRHDGLLDQGAFYIAVLVAPAISISVALWPEGVKHPGVMLMSIFFAELLGFLGTALFLGVAFSITLRLRGPRWAYVVAGAAAALAHTLVGLAWVHIHESPALLLLGFAFEGGSLKQPLEHVLLGVGAKVLGGLCAGAVYAIFSLKPRSTPVEA